MKTECDHDLVDCSVLGMFEAQRWQCKWCGAKFAQTARRDFANTSDRIQASLGTIEGGFVVMTLEPPR